MFSVSDGNIQARMNVVHFDRYRECVLFWARMGSFVSFFVFFFGFGFLFLVCVGFVLF